jgi:hypothetical protein
MSNPIEPILLQLTEEQQEMIHRMSGQHAQFLELTPDSGEGSEGSGRAIQFRWRNSVSSGIPRQQWDFGGASRKPASDEKSSG